MKMQTTLGIVISVGTILGGLVAIDAHYAKSSEVKEVSEYICRIDQRLSEKIQQDRINSLQERMWRLEDRYGVEKAHSMDEYRRLKAERDGILMEFKKKN